MKSKLTALLFVFSQALCFSQGQNYHWHFGTYASIYFAGGGAPVAQTGSALAAEEGSSSISDAAGNLLFYTDGNKVWDKNNVQMPNGFGLGGGTGSCAQAAVILKQPGNTNIYYIFTVDQTAGPFGFSYSTVDMTLNTGLGDVVVKNTQIYAQSSEKISATYHCNGTDIWVATHDYGSNLYRSVLLSSTGVGPSVTSAVGPVLNLAGYTGLGTLKFSPDGTKAAICNYDNNFFDLLDFDNSTGIFSNQRDLYTPGTNLYGLEFSPNSKVLYCSETVNRELFQYDISSGVALTILGTRTSLGVGTQGNLGQLQLGPDKKIYTSQTRTPILGVINSPNTLGTGCNWVELQLNTDVLGSGTVELRFGLPFTLPIRIAPTTRYDTICQGDSISYSGIYQTTIGNYNDTLFSANVFGCDSIIPVELFVKPVSTSTVAAIICQGQTYALPGGMVVSSPGIYIDTIQGGAANGCNDIITTTLSVVSSINTNSSQTICSGQSALIHGVNQGAAGVYSQTYTASGGCDSISSITLIVNNPSSYTLTAHACNSYTINGQIFSSSGIFSQTMIASNGCDSMLTIDLTIHTPSTYTLSANSCDSYTVNGQTYSSSGVYSQTLAGAYGCDSLLTIDLTILSISTASISAESCNSYSVNGQTYSSTGIYTQTLVGANGCDSLFTINLTINATSVFIGNDTTIDVGSSLTIGPLSPGSNSYLWNTGETTSSIIVSPSTNATYIVVKTDNNGCTSSDTITIRINTQCNEDVFVPNSFSPNNDGQNDVLKVFSNSTVKEFYFAIYNRWGEKLFETTDVADSWDGKYKGKQMNSDVYVYLVQYSCDSKESFVKRGNISLVK